MENEVKYPETIEEVQAVLREIPNINNGGCGIAALSIHRWLKESMLHASAMIVFGQRDYNTFKQNAQAQIDTSNKPGAASHIGVLIYDYTNNKQMVIDCDGTFDITEYSYANLTDDKFLLKSINVCDAWNHLFRRKNHVKNIADALGIDLSDVDLRSKYEYIDEETKPIYYSKEEPEVNGINNGYAQLAKAFAQADIAEEVFSYS